MTPSSRQLFIPDPLTKRENPLGEQTVLRQQLPKSTILKVQAVNVSLMPKLQNTIDKNARFYIVADVDNIRRWCSDDFRAQTILDGVRFGSICM